MARPTSKHPTELELEILKGLWQRRGGATGRQVQEMLAANGRDLAKTSVITVLNIMTRKGYLVRKKPSAAGGGGAGGGSHVYSPRVSERATAGRMLRDLVDRVFRGSASAVVLKLLEEDRLDPAELARLREAVDRKAAEAKEGTRP